jgi:CDP-diacylglycerol--serine O-phosphatidyltransferase
MKVSVKRHIPNFITILNLVSGVIACVFIFKPDLITASVFIGMALFFDFLDGALARLLKVQSPLGEQLDSLADVVSFGVAPGLILWSQLNATPVAGYPGIASFLPYFSILIPVFSALRLARFNIEASQKYTFRGLPTPASAIFIASLPLISIIPGKYPVLEQLVTNPLVLFVIIIAFSFLMVSPFHLLSLKFFDFSWKSNWHRYILLLISLVLIIFFHFTAFPFIILAYILISILFLKS